MSDLFQPGDYKIPLTFENNTIFRPVGMLFSLIYSGVLRGYCPNSLIEQISLTDQAAADELAVQPQPSSRGFCFATDPKTSITVDFVFTLTQSGYLYICTSQTSEIGDIVLKQGGTLIGTRINQNTPTQKGNVYRITNPEGAGDIPLPLPSPPPSPSPGPVITECIFPTLSLNFIAVMSGLASWIGCILHNIITILKWFVDWVLHFPDHLDAWISRLFGVDPSLPFFDEVMKKIDIWISGKFGVDPEKPFWEELVKKAIGWLGGGIDEAARKATERLK